MAAMRRRGVMATETLRLVGGLHLWPHYRTHVSSHTHTAGQQIDKCRGVHRVRQEQQRGRTPPGAEIKEYVY